MLEDPATVRDRAATEMDLRSASAEVVQAARNRILQLLELAAAEARLAAMSSLSMLAMIIVASAALIIAWVLIVALAIYLLIEIGVPVPISLIGLVLLHVGAAYGLWRISVRLSRNLTMPKLRGALSAPASTAIAEGTYVQVERAAGAG